MLGDLEHKIIGVLGEMFVAIWRKHIWRFLEKSCSVIWRNRARRFGEIVFGDFGAFGERIGDCHGVTYSPSTVSVNYNGEKMEANYGDQNFINQKVKNTYLCRFRDRNV